jgi:hypothetical protein
MACAAITYNCSEFFHCVKINNFTFCPKLFAAAWAMSRLLWFCGFAFLPRRWRKFALVAGLVCGTGCGSALALCGAVGVCGLRLAVCLLGLWLCVGLLRWPCIGLSGGGCVSVGVGLGVRLACGRSISRTNLCAGEKHSTNLQKPSVCQRTFCFYKWRP